MAKLNIKLKKPTASTFRGWAFVLIAGTVLAVIAVIDRGGLTELRSAATGSTGCVLEVAVAELNVRSGPDQDAGVVQKLVKGDRVDGLKVISGGFRQLAGGQWAFDQYLTPVTGSTCS
ncbi:hypothetical protein [Pseudonocardia sp. GCM10023141]|uniref:hypothetical protein n=1 Tax=Pseudonocardia sp. GCM10023141 TaxID=3252653 RepID=UPI00360DD045